MNLLLLAQKIIQNTLKEIYGIVCTVKEMSASEEVKLEKVVIMEKLLVVYVYNIIRSDPFD